jgi:hypothetical protein
MLPFRSRPRATALVACGRADRDWLPLSHLGPVVSSRVLTSRPAVGLRLARHPLCRIAVSLLCCGSAPPPPRGGGVWWRCSVRPSASPWSSPLLLPVLIHGSTASSRCAAGVRRRFDRFVRITSCVPLALAFGHASGSGRSPARRAAVVVHAGSCLPRGQARGCGPPHTPPSSRCPTCCGSRSCCWWRPAAITLPRGPMRGDARARADPNPRAGRTGGGAPRRHRDRLARAGRPAGGDQGGWWTVAPARSSRNRACVGHDRGRGRHAQRAGGGHPVVVADRAEFPVDLLPVPVELVRTAAVFAESLPGITLHGISLANDVWPIRSGCPGARNHWSATPPSSNPGAHRLVRPSGRTRGGGGERRGGVRGGRPAASSRSTGAVRSMVQGRADWRRLTSQRIVEAHGRIEVESSPARKHV